MPQWLKSWVLPIAMCTGAIFHQTAALLIPLAPAMIFCMLFITFCRIEPHDLHIRRLHAGFLGIQLTVAMLVYLALKPFDAILAQGVMICFLAPTATSAPVVTGMLGGDVAFLTTSAFTSNTAIAFIAPVVFALIGAHSELPFLSSLLLICRQVMPVLILPLVCAWMLRRFAPKPHAWMLRHQMLTFYLWAVTLTIVMGNTVNFVLTQRNPDYFTEILLALGALAACSAQFALGKFFGGLYHDRVSGGQALGQKNTVLAIWMALMYVNPLASLAPASYVLWQNLFNSWQLWRKQRESGLVQQ